MSGNMESEVPTSHTVQHMSVVVSSQSKTHFFEMEHSHTLCITKDVPEILAKKIKCDSLNQNRKRLYIYIYINILETRCAF